jgi:hypothetical protein
MSMGDDIKLDDINDYPISKSDHEMKQIPLRVLLILMLYGVAIGVILGLCVTWFAFILANPHALRKNDEYHSFTALVVHRSGIYHCTDIRTCVLIEPLERGTPCVCGKTLDINMHEKHTTYWHLGALNGSLSTLESLLS